MYYLFIFCPQVNVELARAFNSSVTTTNQTLLGAVCPKLKGRRKWWCGHATMFDEWSIYAKVRLKSTFRIFKARVWLSPWYLIGSQNTWTMFRIHEKCSKSYSHLSSDKSLTWLTFDIWHLNIWIFEHLNIWKFEHLNIWTLDWSNWTFEHLTFNQHQSA